MFVSNPSKACLQRFAPVNWDLMFRNIVQLVVFAVGLVAVYWIGAGYVGTNPIGLAVALVIGACYLAGGLELYRYRQATVRLVDAVQDAAAAQNGLGDWLQRLPASLRNAVRLRIEGERVALPAPVLTPYLVGLLVLLGMLGTLLGMMATLRGTGLALQSATDLQAIRGSLGAPVEGLAVAFGTSIAGVAASAMLGLLAALLRRERLLAVQQLDASIATTLHPHSQAWQRAESFRLLQAQASLMPTLVERLEAMTAAIEQQSVAANERLLAGQEAFHGRLDAAQARFAGVVEQSLRDSVTASTRAVGATLQPILETTLAGVVRETAAVQGVVTDAVQRQLDGLSAGFERSTQASADSWNHALAAQQQANQALTQDLRATLEQLTAKHDERALGLLEGVSSRLDATTAAWDVTQQAQRQAGEHLGAQLRDSVDQLAQQHDARAAGLLDALAGQLQAQGSEAAAAWRDALERQDAANMAQNERHQQALAAASDTLQTQAAALMEALRDSQLQLHDSLAARDAQRLERWSEALGTMSGTLNQNWAQTGEQVAQRQQEICDTLARTAGEMSAQAQAHAADTIAEISQLVQAAAEAPKAAADVVAELRQKLSDSMVRDTAMLDERSRLLGTLETLLDAVNHASTEQRTAVDALVTTSADLLDRVGTRFTDHIQAETGKLETVAAQVTGSAVEVASLAEALGGAVTLFGSSSAGLGERLEQIAGAMDASLARSDDQLAYYVAQAREVIDLSVLSQQQIIEELQQLAGRRGATVARKA